MVYDLSTVRQNGEVNKEGVGIHVLLTGSLCGGGTPRTLLLRVERAAVASTLRNPIQEMLHFPLMRVHPGAGSAARRYDDSLTKERARRFHFLRRPISGTSFWASFGRLYPCGQRFTYRIRHRKYVL